MTDNLSARDIEYRRAMEKANKRFVAALWDRHFYILKHLGARQP